MTERNAEKLFSENQVSNGQPFLSEFTSLSRFIKVVEGAAMAGFTCYTGDTHPEIERLSFEQRLEALKIGFMIFGIEDDTGLVPTSWLKHKEPEIFDVKSHF